MGRLEDELEQLREEIEALQLSAAPAIDTEPAEGHFQMVEHLIRGEEVPEALLDEVFPDEEGKLIRTRDYLDVVREMIAEGFFSDVEVEEDSS